MGGIGMQDIIVIGAGPAGLTAAIYALRAGYQVLVLEQAVYGGQVANTPTVENYPAIEKISGYEFANNLYEQAKSLGAEIKFSSVESVDFSKEEKVVNTPKESYSARVVIIANGAKRRLLGCKGEDTFSGKGVSYCATCDGAFYRGKDVAIVGGGNTALEDALFLSNNCKTVHLIHRRDSFRGNRILADSVKARENIVLHYDSEVVEIKGETVVNAITIRNNKTNEESELIVSGVFVAVGLEPDNQIFAPYLKLDEAGYLVAKEDCVTNVPGVYAAGDTRTKSLRQIVTAAGDGAVAAFEAANYLNLDNM